jgi:alcohol dehydrogenase class IV
VTLKVITCIENLYRPLVSQPVKFLCYGAIKDLFKYLPESKANPTDVGVRQKLQLASWMSLWPMKQEKYRYSGELCFALEADDAFT